MRLPHRPHTADRRPSAWTYPKSIRSERCDSRKLAAAGVSVYNLAGGMQAWREAGQPVIHDDGTDGSVL